MKIDTIYIVCNRKDLYFAKICVASIRYWNKTIPISIIKDFSKGEFNTGLLEKFYDVKIANTTLRKMGYYAKLWPFIENEMEERILILDADIIWMEDLAVKLETYNESLIIDGYLPADLEAEKSRWYFKEPSFARNFQEYKFPGFLFNVGQFICNTSVFEKKDILDLIEWQEEPKPKIKDTFFYEQGMLNYLAAKKIAAGEITFRKVPFHKWGWSPEVSEIPVSDIYNRKGRPYLIHWYGHKYSLLSILPGSNILKNYEQMYYRTTEQNKMSLYKARLFRTIGNLPRFFYHYYKILNQKIFPKAL
ncbi:MAG: hypothetical protein ABIT07_07085 [Ferruginibacter sp.]